MQGGSSSKANTPVLPTARIIKASLWLVLMSTKRRTRRMTAPIVLLVSTQQILWASYSYALESFELHIGSWPSWLSISLLHHSCSSSWMSKILMLLLSHQKPCERGQDVTANIQKKPRRWSEYDKPNDYGQKNDIFGIHSDINVST